MASVGEDKRLATVRNGGTVTRLVMGTLVLSVLLGSCSQPTAPSTEASSSSPPASESKMVSDPAGDAEGGPAFLDLLGAGVAEADNTFIFTVTLAEPIPASFEVPDGW